MKNSNSEKLFELLSQLDDDILEEALQANDKKSFKKTAQKSKIIIFRPLFVKIALWVLCIAIGVSALAINANNINNSLLFGEKSSNSVLESEDNQLSNSQTSKEDFSENQNNSHSQGAQSDTKLLHPHIQVPLKNKLLMVKMLVALSTLKVLINSIFMLLKY